MDRFPFLILVLLFAPSFLISARSTPRNLDPPYGFNSKAVVDELQRRTYSNPIFECWKDPNWRDNPQHLADCGTGFGNNAKGGKGGKFYLVTDPSDNDLINPKQGTLRHALIQSEPLWIIFPAGSMKIKLSGPLYVRSFKTIDGRGGNVRISGKGCLMLEDVTNVIIHDIGISNCAAADSAYINISEAQVKHAGKTKGNGITIIRSHNIWVDNCTISHCANDLIDATLQSTDLTFPNNLYFNKSELLLDRQNNNGMEQVTTVYNRFGKHLTQIPASRSNDESASTTSGSGGEDSEGQNGPAKKGILVKVVVGLAVSVTVLAGAGYVIYKMRNNCGNENICCNCFNGNRDN